MSAATTSPPGRFRRRLTAAFVLVAAASSGVLALTTLAAAAGYRWRNFQDAARNEATIAMALAPPDLDRESFERLRRAYEANVGTELVAEHGGRSFSSSVAITAAEVPAGVRPAAGGSDSAMVRIRDHDYFVVAGTGPDGARYYFVFGADQVQASLEELRVVVAAGWVLTVAGAAAVGYFVARRTLRPVRAAAEASSALAAGLLETRLDPSGQDEFGVWATAFNRMAEALADKINALAAAAERERQFTSDVAHELRTPLTGMAATASLLEEELDALAATARRPAALLVRDVRRLRDLVLELLELARLDGGREPVRLEELNLRRVVRAVVSLLDGQVSEPVTVDVDASVVVLADRARLRRIVTNLVTNALVHGAGPVEITASVPDGGELVELQVADHGAGITAQDLPHVFERFFKSDRSRARGGSGLGLAIADVHARALGYGLAAGNAPGGGAVFSLRLRRPAAPAAGGSGAGRSRPVRRSPP